MARRLAATQCVLSPPGSRRTSRAWARRAACGRASNRRLPASGRANRGRTPLGARLPRAMPAPGPILGIGVPYASPGLSCEPAGGPAARAVRQFPAPGRVATRGSTRIRFAARWAKPSLWLVTVPYRARLRRPVGHSGAGSRVVFVRLLPRFQPRRGLSGDGKLLVPFNASTANHRSTRSPYHSISRFPRPSRGCQN